MINRKIFFGVSALFLAVASCSFSNTQFETSDKDKLLLNLVSYVLDRYHYEPQDIDDNFSEEVFEGFIKISDASKRYFLQSDLEEFEQFRYQIDDQIQNRELDFFNFVYERMMKRIKEARSIHDEVLALPFDFSMEEELDMDYSDQEFVSNRAELKERWRQHLKSFTIVRYDALLQSKIAEKTQSEENDGKRVDVLAGMKMLSKEELTEIEAEARDKIRDNQKDYFDYIMGLEKEDWFVAYLNVIVGEFDPHSSYFPPEDKDYFDEEMSGTFEGIGARLQPQPEGPKVIEIVSGGPAWKSKELEVGDEIIKVAQDGEEPVDIMGMNLNDAVKLIRGPKGTVVHLTLRRVDGTIEVISITRDVVEKEETFAKSATIDVDGAKYGLIHLPSFYVDFKDSENHNAAKGIKEEITQLKRDGVQGLIIDLRDNGGGSFPAVQEMIGYFIESGPVVQVKSPGGDVKVYEDNDRSIEWDGPLVVLVNEMSASASEIFAAAIQDYRRGVIIGTQQTFGKGTVQRFIDLESVIRGNTYGDLGSLKFTIQKFYRIDGGSTQLEGVKSDVVIPERTSYLYLGERDQENTLAWDKISPAKYRTWYQDKELNEVIERSRARVKENAQVALIDENARWISDQQLQDLFPLKFETYRSTQDNNRQRSDYFKTITDYDNSLSFGSPLYELDLFNQDPVLKEKRERWHKELTQDVYVEEAVNVLSDLRAMGLGLRNPEKLAEVKG